MKKRIPSPLEIMIILFSAWQSASLFLSWRGAHVLERHAWIAFLIWIIPIALYRFGPDFSASAKPTNPIILGAALIATVLGMMGSLNALTYLGFAFALSALVPLSWQHLLWIPLAIAWMPSFGYFAKNFFPHYVLLGRIFLAGASCLVFFTPCKEVKTDEAL